VKYKKPLQRACNEKNEKGKICAGHLKRWYYLADVKEQACGDVARLWGKDVEVYRCEHCKTLYLPSPVEPRGLNVAGIGPISDFGLTLPPKDDKDKVTAQTGVDGDRQAQKALPQDKTLRTGPGEPGPGIDK